MDAVEVVETARKMVAGGDAKGAEDFLIEHFKELPEDLQGDLLVEFLKDAGKKNEFQNLGSDVKEAGLAVLDRLDEIEKELEKVPPEGAKA